MDAGGSWAGAEAVADVALHRVYLLLCVVCGCGIFCIQLAPMHEYVLGNVSCPAFEFIYVTV